jgi:hypothetical protein
MAAKFFKALIKQRVAEPFRYCGFNQFCDAVADKTPGIVKGDFREPVLAQDEIYTVRKVAERIQQSAVQIKYYCIVYIY